jgi:hypothetical protein
VADGFRKRLNPSFCNGPFIVNPFFRCPFAGVLLLYGVGAGPPPDRVRRG